MDHRPAMIYKLIRTQSAVSVNVNPSMCVQLKGCRRIFHMSVAYVHLNSTKVLCDCGNQILAEFLARAATSPHNNKIQVG